MNEERIAYLVKCAVERTATADELTELTLLIREDERVAKEIESLLKVEKRDLSNQEIDAMADAVLKMDRPAKLRYMFNPKAIGWKRIAVAAAVIVMLGVGVYLLSHVDTNRGRVVESNHSDVNAPATNRAMITLADGTKVYLDSVDNGKLAQQSDVTVTKTNDGKIIYAGNASEIVYNTLSNPRGSKVIDMTLSDGTRVWLNAESSITYPVSFVGNERKVTITGEAYFEVTHNEKMPFRVSANDVLIEDLGTEFNVNAYKATITTLIKGVVKVLLPTKDGGQDQKGIVLKPGQQILGDKLVGEVDLEKVLAWKNNEFNFHDDNLEEIMDQLSRWYDINPVFIGQADTEYTGRITRTVPISQVLAMFEKLGYVKFEINGKDVKIIPVK